MDSPRGRIYLMKGIRDGQIAWDATTASHFDRCLGCMGCVTACPSGVRYDVLIESVRVAREREVPRRAGSALLRAILFFFFPHPARLRFLAFFLWLYAAAGLRARVARSGALKRLAPRLAQLDALAPPVTFAGVTHALPVRVDAEGRARVRVALVAGCVQRVFFPGVNDATLRVLAKEGCDVVVPEGLGCCGALSLHAGRRDEAKRFARDVVRRIEDAGADVVVVNAAGCGSALKEYDRLFADDPSFRERARIFSRKVRDVSELLASLPPRAERHPVPSTIAYHDACHLAHAQGIRAEPRALLAAVPGLVVREVDGGEQCCGSAGIYNLEQPAAANEIGERKVDAILRTGARTVVSANPGCTLHIQRLARARGEALRALHPIEVLDLSLRGEPLG